MHPKVMADLNVTEDELRDAIAAYAWAREQFVQLTNAVIEAIDSENKRLRALMPPINPVGS